MCFSMLREPFPPPHKRLLPCYPRRRCWLVASAYELFRSLHRRRMDGKGAPPRKGSTSAKTASLRISTTLTRGRRATKRARKASPVRRRRVFTHRGGLPPTQKPRSCPPSEFFFFSVINININIVIVIIIVVIVACIRARLVRSSRTPPMSPAPPPLRRDTEESTTRCGVEKTRRTRRCEGGRRAGWPR